MVSRRIIACLDVAGGKVVKGVRFDAHRVRRRHRCDGAAIIATGADELVLYDIGASPDERCVDVCWIERVAREIGIPFCVAGGIRSVDDALRVLRAGADKVSVNTPALGRPALIGELADAFGSQCVVVGVDSLRDADGDWHVRRNGGDPARVRALAIEHSTGSPRLISRCRRSRAELHGQRRHARRLRHRAARGGPPRCAVPLIASGGAGAIAHFTDVFATADVDGALAASVFHDGIVDIVELKRELRTSHRCAPGQLKPLDRLDWAKGDGLVPAIVQHADDGTVLMLGYMDRRRSRPRSRRAASRSSAWPSPAVDEAGNVGTLPRCRLGRGRLRRRRVARMRAPAGADVPSRHRELLRRSDRGARRGHRCARAPTRAQATRAGCWMQASGASRRRSARKASKPRLPASARTTQRSSARRPIFCITCSCCYARRLERETSRTSCAPGRRVDTGFDRAGRNTTAEAALREVASTLAADRFRRPRIRDLTCINCGFARSPRLTTSRTSARLAVGTKHRRSTGDRSRQESTE